MTMFGRTQIGRTLAMACFAIGTALPTSHAQPIDARQMLDRAQQASIAHQRRQAIEWASKAIAQDPSLAEAFYLRGRERFCVAEFATAADDFDCYAELRPDQRPRLWERGIACYYAGRFRAGADQFSAYQDFDDSDVENAVWHVLCLSRIVGTEAARRQMLNVRQDPRIPMMTIYKMFKGQSTPPDVLQAVEQAELERDQRLAANFYANLYIGLFYEMSGDEDRAREHITKAAEKHRISHYMGDVARVHADRWRAVAERP